MKCSSTTPLFLPPLSSPQIFPFHIPTKHKSNSLSFQITNLPPLFCNSTSNSTSLHQNLTLRPTQSQPESDPLTHFIHQHISGLKPEKPTKLLRSIPSQDISSFISRINLLLKHGIPKDKIGHIINNVNISKVFVEMPHKELEDMILYLLKFGVDISRRPLILNLDFHTQLVPRVEFFIHLSNGDLDSAALIIKKLPNVLSYTKEHFESHLRFWVSVGLTKEQVFRIALVYPNVFSASKDRKIKPRIEFLKQCELSVSDIYKYLIKAPTFLSLSMKKNMSIKLGFLVKLGYKYRTRELAYALGACTRTSSENMQKVIETLLSYGFSYEDVLVMSKKHPQILQYNWKSLEKKMEFLVQEMERDVGEVIVFPAFLGYKLDDRIKRRYEAKKEISGKGMSLNKLLSVSNKRFNLKMSGSLMGLDDGCGLNVEEGC